MKRLIIFVALLILSLSVNGQDKPKYMWIDCEANFQRMGSADSIRFYLERLKKIGFTDVVVDVKSIMGEVLYKSKIAPFMGEWEGHYRSEDFDMMAIFIKEGHKLGFRVHASLNIFAGGHNFFNRGVIYKQYPQWQSQVYWEGKMMPIGEMKWNYNGMMNPANPEVQKYQLDILREFASKYKKLDGLILDRMRFDNITSDFSPLSKRLFEEYSGVKVENFPDDILYWVKKDDGKMEYKTGKLFPLWSEWRAMVIKNFMQDAHNMLRSVNRKLLIGVYTGAWYPSYYYVGVNFTSKDYDPSKEFWWATPNYKNSGYAELMDFYMTGLYYTTVTKEDLDNATGKPGRRDEPGMDNSRTYWYTVEGGAELVKEITRGVVPVIGSLYVEQYEGDAETFSRAVKQALKSNDGGLMIFDMSHIVTRKWWDIIEKSIKGN
ncbi:MAG: alpha amylase family protein [Bacteroidales bacterium]|nr:alpha amylase family protein [Bacteroidales bacterium]